MALHPLSRLNAARLHQPALAKPGHRPAGPLVWDRHHPSLRGCIALLTPGTSAGADTVVDAISGIRFNRANSSFTPTPKAHAKLGRVLNCPSNGYGQDGWEEIGRLAQRIDGLPALSVIAIVRFSSLDQSDIKAEKAAFRCALSNNTGVSVAYLTKAQKLRFLLATTGPTTGWTAANDKAFAMSADTDYVIGFAYDGATQIFYGGELGGPIAEVGSATVTGNVSIASAASAPSVVQGMDYATYSYTGGIDGAVPDLRLFRRALSLREVNDYSYHTYAAAQPTRRVILLGGSAAAPLSQTPASAQPTTTGGTASQTHAPTSQPAASQPTAPAFAADQTLLADLVGVPATAQPVAPAQAVGQLHAPTAQAAASQPQAPAFAAEQIEAGALTAQPAATEPTAPAFGVEQLHAPVAVDAVAQASAYAQAAIQVHALQAQGAAAQPIADAFALHQTLPGDFDFLPAVAQPTAPAFAASQAHELSALGAYLIPIAPGFAIPSATGLGLITDPAVRQVSVRRATWSI